MDEALILKWSDVPIDHKHEQDKFEYNKRKLIPRAEGRQCVVSVYEVPPGKSAYPYHYHTQNEESFYIISGTGLLKTSSGEKQVSEGDFIFFPANEKGAHKLTNNSNTDKLVYLDFGTNNSIDVAFYPDSGKIGIWGNNINQLYRVNDQVDYYDNE